MKNPATLFVAPVGVAVLWAITAFTAATLERGDPAPPFSLPGSDGRTYQLAEYKGKQTVVLAWFAKAFTGG
jgi:peroxiredoxin Q/BCP